MDPGSHCTSGPRARGHPRDSGPWLQTFLVVVPGVGSVPLAPSGQSAGALLASCPGQPSLQTRSWGRRGLAPPGALSGGVPQIRNGVWRPCSQVTGKRRPLRGRVWADAVLHGVLVRQGPPRCAEARPARLAQCTCSAPFPRLCTLWGLPRSCSSSPATAPLAGCEPACSIAWL